MTPQELAFWIGVMVLVFLAGLALQFVALAGQVLRLVLVQAFPALEAGSVAPAIRAALKAPPHAPEAAWLRKHHSATLERLRASQTGLRVALVALAVLVVGGRLGGLV